MPDVREAALDEDEHELGDLGRPYSDKSFLTWLHARMAHVHGENVNVDYMYKLRAIIRATPKDRVTPNCGP